MLARDAPVHPVRNLMRRATKARKFACFSRRAGQILLIRAWCASGVPFLQRIWGNGITSEWIRALVLLATGSEYLKFEFATEESVGKTVEGVNKHVLTQFLRHLFQSKQRHHNHSTSKS
eukprot:scaffold84168_cov39-Attheya_sp.AAC.2